MKKQAAGNEVIWRDFPIDPFATMALRLAQMRLALEMTFSVRPGPLSQIRDVRSQVRGLRKLVKAAEAVPLLLVLLVILEKIDGALEAGRIEFAHQAIVHLERALLGAG